MQILKPTVHLKAWGEEHWLYNGPHYCGKKLYLRKGFRCSMHFHRVKDEVFYLEEGKVLIEAGDERLVLTPGHAIHIPPDTCHRFTGLRHSVITEFSTHHDDADSVRRTISERVPEEEFRRLFEENR